MSDLFLYLVYYNTFLPASKARSGAADLKFSYGLLTSGNKKAFLRTCGERLFITNSVPCEFLAVLTRGGLLISLEKLAQITRCTETCLHRYLFDGFIGIDKQCLSLTYAALCHKAVLGLSYQDNCD